MKKLSIYQFVLVLAVASSIAGCYKLQKDYKYQPSVLDPHLNMSAKEYLLSRGVNGTGSDTIFKWMQLGLEYAGFDMTEFEKPGRTYIFLHNSAIRTITGSGASARVNGGFFFDYPIIGRDSAGNILKSKLDPALDSTRPATSWNEYPKDLVKNYLLYLILQGDYTFGNLKVENIAIPTLLPPNTVADPGKVSKLGFAVTKTSPNPDPTLAASITFNATGANGFDLEGKMNLKLTVNNEDAPIYVNDRTPNRSGGYFVTNGKVHVYDKTIHPFRYSWQ